MGVKVRMVSGNTLTLNSSVSTPFSNASESTSVEKNVSGTIGSKLELTRLPKGSTLNGLFLPELVPKRSANRA
ncbi:MAG: hypothetical protein ACKVT0_12440 [Planctomycetaceae bacterium]